MTVDRQDDLEAAEELICLLTDALWLLYDTACEGVDDLGKATAAIEAGRSWCRPTQEVEAPRFVDRARELFGPTIVQDGVTERGHETFHMVFTDRYEVSTFSPTFYSDNGDPGPYTAGGSHRPCKLCNRTQSDDGPDACLGMVDGLWVACCGHGDTEMAYVGTRDVTIFNGRDWDEPGILRGEAALAWLADHRGVGPHAADLTHDVPPF